MNEHTSATLQADQSDPLTDILLACSDLLWETPKEFDASPNDNEPLLIESIGQVRMMTLPANWRLAKREDQGGTMAFHEVYSAFENEDTTFEFYYRGTPVKESIARAFKATLLAEPHALSADEIHSLGIMVSYALDGNAFKLKRIHTETLNGRRVLIVEGDFLQDGVTRLHVFVDADDRGSAVQELFFQAPTADFKNSVDAGKRAFSSIIWVWE